MTHKEEPATVEHVYFKPSVVRCQDVTKLMLVSSSEENRIQYRFPFVVLRSDDCHEYHTQCSPPHDIHMIRLMHVNKCATGCGEHCKLFTLIQNEAFNLLQTV